LDEGCRTAEPPLRCTWMLANGRMWAWSHRSWRNRCDASTKPPSRRVVFGLTCPPPLQSMHPPVRSRSVPFAQTRHSFRRLNSLMGKKEALAAPNREHDRRHSASRASQVLLFWKYALPRDHGLRVFLLFAFGRYSEDMSAHNKV
jgi:hypothetical protein